MKPEWWPTAQYLSEAGISVSAGNPKLIKDYGNNSLRKVKTDKTDSQKTAKYALDNWTELRQYTSIDKTRYHRTAQKNSLIAILDMTCPGANELFTSPVRGDGKQKWVDFVRTFWHVECVRGISPVAFTERYRKWCRKNRYNFSSDKAIQIYKDELTKTIIQQSVDALTAVSRSVEQLRAELGDVMRFARRSAVTAFAGVDPGANQSGTYETKRSRISKRGSPELRRTLFLVMDCLLKNRSLGTTRCTSLWTRNGPKGKPYLVYMTAGANKFLRIFRKVSAAAWPNSVNTVYEV